LPTVTLTQPPIFIQQGEYSARLTRNITSLIATEGVVGASDFLVTERDPAPALQVTMSPGRAFIDGDDIPNQGNYLVVVEEPVDINVSPADTTDDRIDLLVLRVLDSDAGVVGDEAQLELIPGVPDPSPVPPALPDTAIPVAEVLVQANVIAILNADITDRRTFTESFLAPPLNLEDLEDVDVAGVQDRQALVYNAGANEWQSAFVGASGSAGDEIFWENGTAVTADYTLRTGYNAMTAGPIEIGSAITVTIPVGQVWTVV
jgi:hypothetical protein